MPCERKSPFTTGTYNIQPTSHTENLFPLIGPELPERWRTMRLGKDDLEDL